MNSENRFRIIVIRKIDFLIVPKLFSCSLNLHQDGSQIVEQREQLRWGDELFRSQSCVLQIPWLFTKAGKWTLQLLSVCLHVERRTFVDLRWLGYLDQHEQLSGAE